MNHYRCHYHYWYYQQYYYQYYQYFYYYYYCYCYNNHCNFANFCSKQLKLSSYIRRTFSLVCRKILLSEMGFDLMISPAQPAVAEHQEINKAVIDSRQRSVASKAGVDLRSIRRGFTALKTTNQLSIALALSTYPQSQWKNNMVAASRHNDVVE